MDTRQAEALRRTLHAQGYCLFERALPRQAREEAVAHLPSEQPRHSIVEYLQLHPDNRLIADSVQAVRPLASAAFGDRAQVLRAQLTETVAAADGASRSWHRDLPASCAMPLSLTCVFYLDDVSLSGSTYILPYAATTAVPYDRSHPREVCIPARAGDCLVFDGALWHTGTAHETTRRRAIVVQFGYWWIKQYSSSDRHHGATPDEVLYGLKPPSGDLYVSDR